MWWLSTILTLFQVITVLLAIVLEGKLKRTDNERLGLTSFFKEVRLVSLFGWILIILLVLLNVGNQVISCLENEKLEAKYSADSSNFSDIISKLKEQREIDSLKINELKEILKYNGDKSDSIKWQVAQNAIEELNEQRKIVERQRENTFFQFRNEIADNLVKIYHNYQEDHIRGFADTSLVFVSTRMNNDKIKAYIEISTEPLIIDYLIEISEAIDAVNMYADQVLQTEEKDRLLNINMFLKNINKLKPYLLSVFRRTCNLNSYKEYESCDFSLPEPNIKEKDIKFFLSSQSKQRTIDLTTLDTSDIHVTIQDSENY